MRTSVIAVFCLLLSSCVSNGFETNYSAFNIPPSSKPQPIPFSEEPRAFSESGDISNRIALLYESGYGLIGQASFVGPKASNEQAIAQAKRVGAAVVVLDQKYRETRSGVMNLSTPTVNTTISSWTFNTYGARPISGTYSGTSTTYGTETRLVPYSVDQYDQKALFFAPLSRTGTGMWIETVSLVDLLETNVREGVLIKAVRPGSPAASAELGMGDIIISANGRPTPTYATLMSIFNETTGTPIVLIVAHRYGENSTHEIVIPEGNW